MGFLKLTAAAVEVIHDCLGISLNLYPQHSQDPLSTVNSILYIHSVSIL